MTPCLLQKIAQTRSGAPATRRAILDLILEDPDRVLEESFEQLAERSRTSVPPLLPPSPPRAAPPTAPPCGGGGFAGLRDSKLALAQQLALGGSPLPRRVNIEDAADEMVGKIARSPAASASGVRRPPDMP